jgi:hypothetical protein
MRTIDMPHEVKSASWNHLVYRNLLDTFMSSNHELLWAVDKSKRVILANGAYKSFVFELAGEEVKMDDPVLPQCSDIEMTEKWDHFYTRALQGEKFSVITNYLSKHGQAMIEACFMPICYSDHIMGAACIARTSGKKKQEQSSIPDDIIIE